MEYSAAATASGSGDAVYLSPSTEPELARYLDPGVLAMARWLRGEATIPRSCRSDRWPARRLIELAACVDGYDRHPLDEQLDGEQWGWAMRNRIAAGRPRMSPRRTRSTPSSTLYRADRHSGGAIEHDPVAHAIAVELRRRVRAWQVTFRRPGAPRGAHVRTTEPGTPGVRPRNGSAGRPVFDFQPIAHLGPGLPDRPRR